MPQARTVYDADKATAIAAEMQTYDESGWTYVAEVVDPEKRHAIIAVYDEEGLLAGIL